MSRDTAGLPPGYLPCAVLALAAIWGHHFPAGIDLPQHANLVRLWHELARGPVEYGLLFRISLFTPYVLAYAIAYPFASWGSALVGIKVVLTLSALGTPWTMARWLRVVGGHPVLGLVGFPVVFGFAYLWGFLSHCLALPLLFGYLESFERPGERPSLGRIVLTTAWGLVLFFCHGVTFGVAAVSAGLRVLARPRPHLAYRAALHLVPLAGLTLFWLRVRERRAAAEPNWWFIDQDRLVTLFSGLFWPKPSLAWAGVTVVALMVAWGMARPRVNPSLGATIPLLIAVAGFVILPEYIASTYLVGTRFVVYVQAFAPALWLVASDRERRLDAVVPWLIAASLLLLNARLFLFNRELEGFRAIASHIEPYADVQTYLPRLGGDSDIMGPRELSEVPAWVSAENGGLIENDSAHYFQMPVQRRPLRSRRYPYIFARGQETAVLSRMAKAFPDAVVRERSDSWFLFERKALRTDGVTVVRSAQEWGELAVDHSVAGTPLVIAAVTYEHGLGTHAFAFLRLRAAAGKSTIEGACGVDDGASVDARVSFRIRASHGPLLFQTGVLTRGAPPVSFSVPVEVDREVVLEVLPSGRNTGDHADCVDLH